jgi:hypothetical protein
VRLCDHLIPRERPFWIAKRIDPLSDLPASMHSSTIVSREAATELRILADGYAQPATGKLLDCWLFEINQLGFAAICDDGDCVLQGEFRIENVRGLGAIAEGKRIPIGLYQNVAIERPGGTELQGRIDCRMRMTASAPRLEANFGYPPPIT